MEQVTTNPKADNLRYGYARCSQGEEDLRNLSLQVDALLADGIRKDLIYTDIYTGGRFTRPGWTELVEKVQPGDVIVVQYLDRFARTVLEGLQVVEELTNQGIYIKCLNDPIDTSDGSAAAKAQLQMSLVFAEWQRNTTRERIVAGQNKARAAGPALQDDVPPSVRPNRTPYISSTWTGPTRPNSPGNGRCPGLPSTRPSPRRKTEKTPLTPSAPQNDPPPPPPNTFEG